MAVEEEPLAQASWLHCFSPHFPCLGVAEARGDAAPLPPPVAQAIPASKAQDVKVIKGISLRLKCS